MFTGGEELLFSNLSMDLEDLFSDDLMNFLEPFGRDDEFTVPSTSSSPMDLCVSDMLKTGALASAASTELQGASTSSQNTTDRSRFQTSAPLQLQVQRCSGPPTKNHKKQGPVRLVTTQVTSVEAETKPSTSPEFMLSSKRSQPCSDDDMSDGDSDSDASNNTEEYALTHGHKKQNKRKAPEVDWRAISDPAERRRQRRLAKNRVTAARSRERKKVQWTDLETKLSHLDNDNKRLKAMLQQLAQENSMLRGQLEGMVRGVDAPDCLKGHSHSAEPAALVFISILLLLCCALPGDQAMLLGSAAPMLLLAHMLSSSKPDQPSLADHFLRFLATIRVLLSRSSLKLKAGVQRMLYRRPQYLGRRVLQSTAAWAAASWPTGQHLSTVKEEPSDESKFDPTGFLISGLF